MVLAFCHGDKYNPCPAAITLQPVPFFFKYNTPPDPLILSTILLPAAVPTPVRAPVASDGNTLLSRNLPAIANAGKMAPMKPPSTCCKLYCSCALDNLIVAPFQFCHAIVSLLTCCCVKAITCSPCRSACFSFIDTGFFDCMASLILSRCPSLMLILTYL